MLQKNNHLFSHAFEGFIWKIRLDSQESILILELRMEESRQVVFSGIDLVTKKVCWTYKSEEEPWWLSLYQAGCGKTILNGMEGYDNPAIKGIEVLDSRTGRFLLREKNFIPFRLENEGLTGRLSREKNELYFLDFTSCKINMLQADHPFSDNLENVFVVNPNSYTKENTFFSKLAEFVHFITGLQAVEVIEYLEYNQKIIVSFYSFKEEKLVNYLLVTDEKGEVLLKEELGSGLTGLASDTFFLSGDLLICVKNRKELVIFEL